MTAPKHTRDWNDLAQMDPMWAILTEPGKQYGNWATEEFFRTGIEEISALREVLATLGFTREPERALDFGCGLGRLTVALRQFVPEAVGVDISPAMIERASTLNPECRFVHNPYPDLRIFPSEWFDLIYSRRVLQHQGTTAEILRYVSEFVRVLKPGGVAAFQIPSRIPWLHRLQPRRRVYGVLRALRFPSNMLYRWRFHPMRMTGVPEREVCAAVVGAGGRVLLVTPDDSCPGDESRFYHVTR